MQVTKFTRSQLTLKIFLDETHQILVAFNIAYKCKILYLKLFLISFHEILIFGAFEGLNLRLQIFKAKIAIVTYFHASQFS